MKKSLLLFLMICSMNLIMAQTQTSATYSSGDIPTPIGAYDPACNGPATPLVVTIPAGDYVFSVDVVYDFTAQGGAWMSEQSSQIYCQDTGLDEGGFFTGTGGNLGGVENYTRTGLDIANGVDADGILTFEMQAFRSWGGTLCDLTYQIINDGTWTVTVNHGPPPTCLPPSGGTVSAITGADALFTLTENGTATAWDIEFGLAGFTPNGTPTAGYDDTTNPVTLTGLSGITDYEVYYRSDCAMDNTTDPSIWIGPVAFTTACTSFTTFPACEDFADGAIPNCWNESSSSGADNWIFSTAAAYGAAAAGDHTTGGATNYAWVDGSFATLGETVTLESPIYDVASLTNPFISFWVFSNNVDNPGDNNILTAELWDGAAWVLLGNIQGDNPNWVEYTYEVNTVATLTGTEIQLRFTYEGAGETNTFNNDMLLDDVCVMEAPTCLNPSNLANANVTATDADISWTENGTATAWDIEVVPAGTAPTGTPTVNDVTTNPYTLTGLDPATEYDVYLRADCGMDDTNVSMWIGQTTFLTNCVAITTFPACEDFTAGATPVCWSESSSSGTDNWIYSTNAAYGAAAAGDHTTGGGTNYAWVDGSFSTLGETVTLLSPVYDIASLTTPFVSFWVFSNNTDNPGDNNILTAELWDGAAWILLDNIQGDNSAWQEFGYEVNTVATLTGTEIQLRFTYTGAGEINTFNNDILLDDVCVMEAPSCLNVTGAAAANITDTSADVSWTEVGTATAWDIEIVPGGTAATGTPTYNDEAATTYSFSGLTPITAYDVYLRADCGMDDTDVSMWIGPISFTTLCAPYTPDYLEDFATMDFNVPAPCWAEANDQDLATGPAVLGDAAWTDDDFANVGGTFTGAAKINLWNLGDNDWMISPVIDLTAGGPYQAEFDFAITNFGGTNAVVLGSDDEVHFLITTDNGATWSPLQIWTNADNVDPTGIHPVYDLTTYTGMMVQFAFFATEGIVDDPEDNDIFVDNFEVRGIPSCNDLSSVAVANITDNSADVSWVSNGTETAWDIEVVPAGTAPTGVPTYNDVTTNPYTVTGLTDATAYDVYVRADCGMDDTDVSVWEGPANFTTLCLPGTADAATPFCEEFDTPISCWTQAGTQIWEDSGAGYVIASFWSFTAGQTMTYQSQPIDIDAGMNPELSFDWSHLYSATYPGDSLAVNISSDGGGTWTTLWTAGGANLDSGDGAGNTTPGTFATETISLVGYEGQQVIVELAATSGFGPDLFVSQVCVQEAPVPCLAPTGLDATNIDITTADLSWTAGNAETVWEIEYGPAGFTPGTGTTVSNLFSPAFNATGLQEATDYDYYACSSCGALETALIITGTFDGPLTGGHPKGVELYALEDIADLSQYGMGSANNGGGTDGEELTFPAVSLTAGQFYYVAADSTGFADFFGFNADVIDSAANINGDDAIELFNNGVVVDIFGDINVDGSGQAWDHLDGWAYRTDMTGPDGDMFTLANWSFSGIDAFDGQTDNATAATPFPTGSFTPAALPTVTTECAGPFSFTTLTSCTPTTGAEDYTGCTGDGYTVDVNGVTYDEANPSGTEVLTNAEGCDSTVTVTLVFNAGTTGNEDYTGCAGDGYTVDVNGMTYDEANPTGTETLTGVNGCDSVVTVNLVFNAPTAGNEDYTGCMGDGYTVDVNGTTYDEANPSGTETLTDANGCDSVVTVTLVFNAPTTGNEDYTGCASDGYTVDVNGTTYDEANPSGTETLTGANGCDSVVTVNLVFNAGTTGNEDYTGCAGDGYTVDVNGTTYDEANPSGTETLTGANGCDSVVTVNLVFNAGTTGNEDYTGCAGDGYTVDVNGTTYDEANPAGTETLTGMNGCDSVVTVSLMFMPTSAGMETYTGCAGDGYAVDVNGVTYDEANPAGTETLVGMNGCDSVVTIALVFTPSSTGTETYAGCEGDGFSVDVNGTTYDETNPIGEETLTGSNGCDSIVTITLLFDAPSTGAETYAGCTGDGYSVDVNGTTYDEANPTGEETLVSTNGCDSIVTINLSFSPTMVITLDDVTGSTGADGAINITVTGGTTPYTYTWSNADTNEDQGGLATGDYTVTVTDASGCEIVGGPYYVTDLVDVNDIEELTLFNLYPNPTKNQVNIGLAFTDTKDFTLEIVNALGQVMMSNRYEGISQTNIELDVTHLSQGIYFVRIISAEDNSQAVERLIISK